MKFNIRPEWSLAENSANIIAQIFESRGYSEDRTKGIIGGIISNNKIEDYSVDQALADYAIEMLEEDNYTPEQIKELMISACGQS